MNRNSYVDIHGRNHWADADAGDNLYYSIDFDAWITQEGDTLSSVSWSLPPGVSSSDSYELGNKAFIKIKTPISGEYKIICMIETVDSGRTQTNTVPIWIKVY